MTMNPTRFRVLLATAAVLMLAAGGLAADKEQPKRAAPPQAAPANVSSDVNAPAPKDASPSQSNETPRAAEAAPTTQLNPPESNAGNNAQNINRTDGDKNRDQRNRDGQRDSGRRAYSPSGAVRHQTNRPSSDTNAARPQAGDARGNRQNTNIGLAFGTGGLVISSVGPNGYFVDTGFRQGDRIVSANGRRFANQGDFYTWLGTAQAGQRMPIVILRNGQEQTVYWTPNEEFVQNYAQAAPANATNDFLGIRLNNEIQDAAVVADVQSGSPAQRAGVRPNDMILEVNGQQVSSPDEFADATAAIQPGAPVELALSRTMNVRVIPAGQAEQSGPQVRTGPSPAPAVVAPAPVQTVPVTPAPAPRRGLLRNR